MRHAVLLSLLLVGLIEVASSSASAQSVARVRVEEFTVDGDPPPEQYRQVLADAIRPTIGSVEQCYDRRLAVNPTLAGDYRLRLWVSARQVIRATPETSIGDSELEECARAAIRTFTLPPQVPEGGATVRFVVRFTAPPRGTVPPAPAVAPVITAMPIAPPVAAVAAAPRVTRSVRRLSGTLDVPSLESTFPPTAFEACATGPTGVFTVNVWINTRGVIAATPVRGTLRDRPVMRCVELAIEALRAPTARGSTRARLTFDVTR